MKILQIASGDFLSTYGGGQVYVKNLVDEMIRQQYELSVISFVDTPTAIEKKDYHGIELYEIGLRRTQELSSLLVSLHPSLIHAHSQKAMITRMGRELGIPVIVTAHHGGILCPAGTLMNNRDEICQTTIGYRNCLGCCLRNIRSGAYWYPFMKHLPESTYLAIGKSLERKVFIPFITPIGQTALHISHKQKEWEAIQTNASALIAPSRSIAEAMIRNGASQKKVTVIPHGIPLPPSVPPFPSTQTGLHFFYIGRICYVKGIHRLLEAFNALQNQQSQLHLIGGAERKDEKCYMQRLQRQYATNKNIIWHGKIEADKVFETIQDFHVLIHPTICLEIFGLNIAEALAMGKPVLATRCGGAEMQIEEGVNGWLVAPNDAIALRKKIEEIISLPPVAPLSPNKVVSLETHCKELDRLYRNINKTLI